MAVILESREKEPGVRTLHHNDDEIVAFTGEAYLRNLPYLIKVGTVFARQNLGWTEKSARFMMTRGLGVDHLTRGLKLNDQTIPFIVEDANKLKKVPSVFLFRAKDSKEGEYIGYVAQRMFFIQTETSEPGRSSGEEVPTMYQIFRAIEQGQRGKNRARSSIELALFFHEGARWFFHRTANYLAAYTNTQSDSLDQKESYPWGYLYNNERPFAQELIRRGFNLVKVNGEEIEETGVSRNDYCEPNLGIEKLRPGSKEEIVKVHRMMHEDFKMGPHDSLYALYKVK